MSSVMMLHVIWTTQHFPAQERTSLTAIATVNQHVPIMMKQQPGMRKKSDEQQRGSALGHCPETFLLFQTVFLNYCNFGQRQTPLLYNRFSPCFYAGLYGVRRLVAALVWIAAAWGILTRQQVGDFQMAIRGYLKIIFFENKVI
jgi:hypothetical protein